VHNHGPPVNRLDASGNGPSYKGNIRELLLGLKDSLGGRQILDDMKESALDPLPAGSPWTRPKTAKRCGPTLNLDPTTAC